VVLILDRGEIVTLVELTEVYFATGRIQQEGKKTRWIETEEIIAEAYDQIIPGFDTDATNTLRRSRLSRPDRARGIRFRSGSYPRPRRNSHPG
jgi:hypothetical protein